MGGLIDEFLWLRFFSCCVLSIAEDDDHIEVSCEVRTLQG